MKEHANEQLCVVIWSFQLFLGKVDGRDLRGFIRNFGKNFFEKCLFEPILGPFQLKKGISDRFRSRVVSGIFLNILEIGAC